MTLVLVVDDDPGARLALEDVLTEEGYEVMVAEDGRRALAQLEGRTPHLLLTDLEMPEVDGEQLIASVRNSHPGLPILVITSRVVSDVHREAERLGAVGFLNKPLDIDVLLDRLRSALA
ncbi:response regulator [Paraliomyxa miuraensis]|uniref:response regulator n=1 Tax=Paraliomyxa miuraensis TaxID=376150 RepID=UPI00224D3797|nr:response regulator [Paraliomyxa miuraensis]MCX4247263.1 response regulator [Paraliomyxa miuraensis]